MNQTITLHEGDILTVKCVAKPPPTPPLEKELFGTLEGVPIYASEFKGQLRMEWLANMTIDCDGSGGNPDNDPYFQDDTSLHHNGEALNAYEVPFIVVPPMIRNGVEPVVMGCQAMVLNTKNGLSTAAVVGDQGPSSKIGEASCECAQRVGLDGDPNSGGCDENCILYEIFPGQPAVVDGITYTLAPA